jgi:hypothetical protein
MRCGGVVWAQADDAALAAAAADPSGRLQRLLPAGKRGGGGGGGGADGLAAVIAEHEALLNAEMSDAVGVAVRTKAPAAGAAGGRWWRRWSGRGVTRLQAGGGGGEHVFARALTCCESHGPRPWRKLAIGSATAFAAHGTGRHNHSSTAAKSHRVVR